MAHRTQFFDFQLASVFVVLFKFNLKLFFFWLVFFFVQLIFSINFQHLISIYLLVLPLYIRTRLLTIIFICLIKGCFGHIELFSYVLRVQHFEYFNRDKYFVWITCFIPKKTRRESKPGRFVFCVYGEFKTISEYYNIWFYI